MFVAREEAHWVLACLGVVCVLSACDVSPRERYEVQPVADDVPETRTALAQCLVGRQTSDDPAAGKMPVYNYGHGHLCNRLRLATYRECMKTEGAVRDGCTREADAMQASCEKDPCPEAYNRCIQNRCTRQDNSWDCWKRNGDAFDFGYWDWKDGTWSFHNVAEESVAADVWRDRCDRVEERCELGLAAEAGEPAPPVDRSFPSAAVAGHNCHHATQEVCSCLLEHAAELEPRVVVLDYAKANKPEKIGNSFHSLVVINHPETPGKRCVVESQWKYGSYSIDETCCFSSRDEFMKLPEAGCGRMLYGPFKKKHNLQDHSVYQCDGFLDARGVADAEVPLTRLFSR